ncbi:MAG: NAD(P)H-hydrate dehydratase [Limnobacter sp.]|nr:NAD(P)H-hydrate dehydratase [Limnobacter sp.]
MSQAIELNLENLNTANWKSVREHDLPVCNVEQIRQLEEAAFAKVDSYLMMQAAGFRTAQHVVQELTHRPEGKPRFLVLAGPGNNGGDACLVAGKLHLAGFRVDWVQVKSDKPASQDRQKAEAWCRSTGLIARHISNGSTEPCTDSPKAAMLDDIQSLIQPNTWIVDGLLGIGCNSPPAPVFEKLIQQVNQARSNIADIRVLALDCPSGLDCSTGLAPGAAIQADSTYTYIALKTGLLCNQGKDLAGEVRVDSLGCNGIVNTTPMAHVPAHVFSDETFKTHLPRRKHNHHKGSFGSLAVIGGAPGMVGAALLAARTAIQLGAGRVALSLISELDQRMPDVQVQGFQPYLDPLFPELMNKSLDDNFNFSDCLVVGPGMGESFDSVHTLHRILDDQFHKPMVWDADALNLLAAHPDLQEKLIKLRNNLRTEDGIDQAMSNPITPPAALILTPHPLEAARLLGSTSAKVNANRVKSAQTLAQRFQCTVVLKGAGTVIADERATTINCTGGPMLATAGSGDVLAGAIGALLAQQVDSTGLNAAQLGVWLHGLACEPLPSEKYAPAICSASGLILRIQGHFNRLLHEHSTSSR